MKVIKKDKQNFFLQAVKVLEIEKNKKKKRRIGLFMMLLVSHYIYF